MSNQSGNKSSQFLIEEIDPQVAYEQLVVSENSFLVDVRSQAEWNFVGTPDASEMQNDVIFCEWAAFPTMIKNPNFLEELMGKIKIEKARNIYFICRSGSRSFGAASEVNNFIQNTHEKLSQISCVNVRYGFEGDLSRDSKRGKLNGWKYSDLPWKQL